MRKFAPNSNTVIQEEPSGGNRNKSLNTIDEEGGGMYGKRQMLVQEEHLNR